MKNYYTFILLINKNLASSKATKVARLRKLINDWYPSDKDY